jgi:hypothetical protein
MQEERVILEYGAEWGLVGNRTKLCINRTKFLLPLCSLFRLPLI